MTCQPAAGEEPSLCSVPVPQARVCGTCPFPARGCRIGHRGLLGWGDSCPGRRPWDGDEPKTCLLQPYLLPTVEGKDPSLKYISPGTVRGQRSFRSPPEGGCVPVPHPGPRVSPLGDALPPQLEKVLTGRYSSFIERSVVVDCRYPYEYQGGHIKVRAPAGPGGKGGVRAPRSARGAELTTRG